MKTCVTIARSLRIALLVLGVGVVGTAIGQPVQSVLLLAQKERPALLESLKELTAFESGSRDLDELDRLANWLAARFRALGASVDLIEATEADTYRLSDTPERLGRMVRATFPGVGKKKILLLAHMDTVYAKGMHKSQPFRVDGNRAYGLAIADDRHGIAVILHALGMLRELGFNDFGTITVLINADEEISSPGSRNQIGRLGAEHDVVLSFEGGGNPQEDQIRLATSGTARAILTVHGRASHAGVAPELGVNALYELAFQVLQMRDLSDPATGVKVNWTLARAGQVSGMIPPEAQASASVRANRVADFDAVEQRMRDRMKRQLLPEARLELAFERRFLPLEAKPASRTLGTHAQVIYRELGLELKVREDPSGGATDAANAAVKSSAPVIEGMGLRGYGSHSIEAEYILVDSIEPRLYLLTRLIMDVAQGKAP